MRTFNLKFKVRSQYKACAFCSENNIPVIMAMHTGKAICDRCLTELSSMIDDPDNLGTVIYVNRAHI